jgi:hypothetical protein
VLAIDSSDLQSPSLHITMTMFPIKKYTLKTTEKKDISNKLRDINQKKS